MRGAASIIIGSMLVGAALFWFASAPQTMDAAALPAGQPDLGNGEVLFNVGGCASCHAADGAKGEDRLLLSGGHRLTTPFGIFVVPNLSTDPEHGIGTWSAVDFVNAMRHGTSPDGRHYFPAFPYTSYARMTDADLLDLWAYLRTLPASTRPNEPHEVGFPFNIRRTLGLWKRLYLSPAFVTDETGNAELDRGRYLVEGPGHCGECHSPRNPIGGLDQNRWLAGAPNPAGKGKIPDITPTAGDFGGWSEGDIVEFLTSGFTPEYDSVGGSMVAVVENTSRLPETDRRAIAAYLKALPTSN